MEPNHNNYGPPTELPQPQEVNGQSVPEFSGSPQPEARGMQMPGSGVPQQQNATAAPDPHGLQQIGIGGAQDPSQVVNTATTASLMADDADLIEKEWVIKAKAIVLQTKDDPHEQNREMNKVKADYLKKRYNKDLKTSEG